MPRLFLAKRSSPSLFGAQSPAAETWQSKAKRASDPKGCADRNFKHPDTGQSPELSPLSEFQGGKKIQKNSKYSEPWLKERKDLSSWQLARLQIGSSSASPPGGMKRRSWHSMVRLSSGEGQCQDFCANDTSTRSNPRRDICRRSGETSEKDRIVHIRARSLLLSTEAADSWL